MGKTQADIHMTGRPSAQPGPEEPGFLKILRPIADPVLLKAVTDYLHGHLPAELIQDEPGHGFRVKLKRPAQEISP